MSHKGPILTLNNGIDMPALGLGVYRSSPDETVDAVDIALKDGYRLIDTAAAYGNEAEVGEGIRRNGIDRSKVFVTTKLKPADYGFDSTLRAFDTSMAKLGFDILDLYLLHWPIPSRFDDTVASWKAAERLLTEGRTRAIGVCNFNPDHLDDLIARSEIVPAVNQVELHPFLTQKAVRDANARLGIITQAWSPIGGVHRYFTDKPEEANDPLKNAAITSLADKYHKTPAQIILRWHVERGHSVIPKSVHEKRIHENGDVFDFALTDQEIPTINALNRDERGGPNPETHA